MAPKKQISIDVSTGFGRGRVTEAQLKKLSRKTDQVFARVNNEIAEGKLGFWKLPYDMQKAANLKPILEMAKQSASRYENLVVIGIGGSSLGGRMLLNALCNRYHNELPAAKRGGMRVYFMENSDPDSFSDLLAHIDMKKTLFNVISKSGATAETAAQFVLVRGFLKEALPKEWKKHLLFTTDPENGSLRKLANEEGIETLTVPQDVGGRFSILSAVGLFPAACMGIDIKALLRGAKSMAERCNVKGIWKNPALNLAVLHYLADTQHKKNMTVVFPYADSLQGFAEWFCQLWAESLGKSVTEDGKPINSGTTPIKALGAIDQHSQMQLYMEGPDDKLYIFIRNEKFDRARRFPAKAHLPAEQSYFAGHSMEELILAEETASRFALGKYKRLNYEIRMPKIDADSLGQLIFLTEAMTTFAGYLYGVNPFDQPGVELGKKYAYGLMGRDGFDKYLKEIEKLGKPAEKYLL